jgi:hypothetical protein
MGGNRCSPMKADLNRSLLWLRGTIDGGSYKRSPHGQVITRKPDMSRVKWSPKQEAHRARMAEAVRYYRAIRDNPEQAARYRELAKAAGLSVSAYVIGLRMLETRPGGENPPKAD